jgi:hypothetical protein
MVGDGEALLLDNIIDETTGVAADVKVVVGTGELVGAASSFTSISSTITATGDGDGPPAHSAASTQPSFVVQHSAIVSNMTSHGALSTMPPHLAVPAGSQSRTHAVPVLTST